MDEYQGRMIGRKTYIKFMIKYNIPLTEQIDGQETYKRISQMQHDIYNYETFHFKDIHEGLYYNSSASTSHNII